MAWGAVRGLSSEVMALLGWMLAYGAAQAWGPTAQPWVPVGAAGSDVQTAAAFAAVFLATLVAWTLLTWVVRKMVQASPLHLLDRALGVVFGAVRAVVIGLVLVTLVAMTPWAQAPLWQQSRAVAALGQVLHALTPWLSPDLLRHLPRGPEPHAAGFGAPFLNPI